MRSAPAFARGAALALAALAASGAALGGSSAGPAPPYEGGRPSLRAVDAADAPLEAEFAFRFGREGGGWASARWGGRTLTRELPSGGGPAEVVFRFDVRSVRFETIDPRGRPVAGEILFEDPVEGAAGWRRSPAVVRVADGGTLAYRARAGGLESPRFLARPGLPETVNAATGLSVFGPGTDAFRTVFDVRPLQLRTVDGGGLAVRGQIRLLTELPGASTGQWVFAPLTVQAASGAELRWLARFGSVESPELAVRVDPKQAVVFDALTGRMTSRAADPGTALLTKVEAQGRAARYLSKLDAPAACLVDAVFPTVNVTIAATDDKGRPAALMLGWDPWGALTGRWLAGSTQFSAPLGAVIPVTFRAGGRESSFSYAVEPGRVTTLDLRTGAVGAAPGATGLRASLPPSRSVRTADERERPLLEDVYVFPNPATGPVVFHAESSADAVHIRVYDVAGSLVHEARAAPGDYRWDAGVGAGVYVYAVSAEKAGRRQSVSGKLALLR